MQHKAGTVTWLRRSFISDQHQQGVQPFASSFLQVLEVWSIRTPRAVQISMQFMIAGIVHMGQCYVVLAVVALKQHAFCFQSDLQSRQIGDVLEFASESGQLVMQLLLVAVQLQQLG